MNTHKVDAALALDRHSTHWQVELSPDETAYFVAHALAYNDFTQDDLLILVKTINRALPLKDFGGNNPNNGKPLHSYRVGNESSRVIYLDIRKFYLNGRWNAGDYDLLARWLDALATEAHADEFAVDRDDDMPPGHGTWSYRFWWD